MAEVGLVELIINAILGLYAVLSGVAIGLARIKQRELQEELSKTMLELERAKVDSNLLRALGDGEIGIDDLKEVGLFDKAQQASTGKLAGLMAGSEDRDTAGCEYQPFKPLPYKRKNAQVGGLIVRDEVWINPISVHHTSDGYPAIGNNAEVSPTPTFKFRYRIRVLADGYTELAVDPDDEISTSGFIVDEERHDIVVFRHVTKLKPEDRWRQSLSPSLRMS
jgi:hypothetical protein